MGKANWWDAVDDMFDMFDGDPKKKKSKKKKAKKKDKGPITTAVDGQSKATKKAMKNLKGLSRSELLQRMDKLSIPLDTVDVTDKKAMRQAIMKRMVGPYLSPSGGDKVPVGMSAAEHEAKIRPWTEKSAPPYYMDEDSGEFIIPQCRTTTDLNCFNAMMALGAVRTKSRPDDGFGELMRRISKALDALPEASSPTDVIDVTDFKVIDTPAGLKDKPGEGVKDEPNWLLSEAGKAPTIEDEKAMAELVPRRHKLPEPVDTLSKEEIDSLNKAMDAAFGKAAGKSRKKKQPKPTV